MRSSSRVTIRDVAARAGVSIATVSKVINQRYGVSEETNARVLAVIEELGYEASLVAQSLRNHRTNVIGILVLGGWWDVATWPYQRPDLVDLRLRRQSRARWTVLGALWWLLKRYVSILAPFGVALLVVEAVTSTPLVRNVRGLGEFLALGLAVWVVLVLNQLFDLLEAPTPVHTAATPMSSWRGNRALNLLRLALAVPNLLVPALQADFVLPRFVEDLREALGDKLTVHEMDSSHMIYHEKPAELGKLVTDFLG
ncbi:LacI family DNA-binding transcriptional regulator [Kibdelosporangium lantanae]|uniref:LacI family DNA-binding transcriptional regulator n=1 Tax=Kibdelosporangium lantanae TaxID=1497396 RepID=A0ABW3MGU2_9PSEU